MEGAMDGALSYWLNQPISCVSVANEWQISSHVVVHFMALIRPSKSKFWLSHNMNSKPISSLNLTLLSSGIEKFFFANVSPGRSPIVRAVQADFFSSEKITDFNYSESQPIWSILQSKRSLMVFSIIDGACFRGRYWRTQLSISTLQTLPYSPVLMLNGEVILGFYLLRKHHVWICAYRV